MTTDPIQQEPLEQTGTRPVPDPNTDFGDELFDSRAMPQKTFSTGGITDFIFGLTLPKTKGTVPPSVSRSNKPPLVSRSGNDRADYIPQGQNILHGLLTRKKTLAETVRDQIKFPPIKNVNSIINGAALVVFAVGSCILYSELPTRPELVIGILLVIIAGNVIVNNR